MDHLEKSWIDKTNKITTWQVSKKQQPDDLKIVSTTNIYLGIFKH